MLNSTQLIQLALDADRAGRKGLVEAKRRANNEAHQAARKIPSAYRASMGPTHSADRFLADLADLPEREPVAPFVHPVDRARFAPPRTEQSREATALDAVDLAWLQRLPNDPDQVTFADAVELASLAQSYTKLGSASARLLASYWRPVQHRYDLIAAERRLEQAKRPPSPIPPSLEEALTDAVAAEIPELLIDEARNRAIDMVRDALFEREQLRLQRVDQAATDIDQLRAVRSAQTSLVGV